MDSILARSARSRGEEALKSRRSRIHRVPKIVKCVHVPSSPVVRMCYGPMLVSRTWLGLSHACSLGENGVPK